ncbi:MAG: NAD(P)-binding protein [Actinomycetota bacterium]|nr:NAD(P)-binding protein [Actinomycetota bacterium]
MSTRGEIVIYGAGMSGLIAAINLAKEDYKVTVHDREKGFGGDSIYNPSTHTTSIDVDMTSEYIGIDLSSVFHPLRYCPFYFHDTAFHPPLHLLDMHTVERGNRPSSLDSLLYAQAKELGVDFKFNSPLRKEVLHKLPDNTIIACGLAPSVYEMLDIPYLRWYGWISRGEIGFSDRSWIWIDEVITEYGYLSSCNNYYFNLLFSNRHIDRRSLEKYQDFIIRHEGVEHKNWEYISGAVPIASPDNPRLFHNGLIMCGTISGAMDPFFWFGILGALVTGKVAAMAVYDRRKAEEDFERFTRRFSAAYLFKNLFWYRIRPHVGIFENGINFIGQRRFEKLSESLFKRGSLAFATPGFGRLGTY